MRSLLTKDQPGGRPHGSLQTYWMHVAAYEDRISNLPVRNLSENLPTNRPAMSLEGISKYHTVRHARFHTGRKPLPLR